MREWLERDSFRVGSGRDPNFRRAVPHGRLQRRLKSSLGQTPGGTVAGIIPGGSHPNNPTDNRLRCRAAKLVGPDVHARALHSKLTVEIGVESKNPAPPTGPQARLEELIAQTRHADTLQILETRFGAVPPEIAVPLQAILDDTRLSELLQFAVQCPDLKAFSARLLGKAKPTRQRRQRK